MSSGWPTSRTGATLVTEPVVDRDGPVSGAEGVVVPSGFGAPGRSGPSRDRRRRPPAVTRGAGAGEGDAAATPDGVAEA